jgi:hypothetical protein
VRVRFWFVISDVIQGLLPNSPERPDGVHIFETPIQKCKNYGEVYFLPYRQACFGKRYLATVPFKWCFAGKPLFKNHFKIFYAEVFDES